MLSVPEAPGAFQGKGALETYSMHLMGAGQMPGWPPAWSSNITSRLASSVQCPDSACVCRVTGPLGTRSVRHVGAGLNLTVACTTDGAVWQMGTTTAATRGYSAPWEGCSTPVQASCPLCPLKFYPEAMNADSR